MSSRVCNRELFKYFLALKKAANIDESVEVDYLTAKKLAGSLYRESKTRLKGKLGTSWTTDKTEFQKFTIESSELAKFFLGI